MQKLLLLLILCATLTFAQQSQDLKSVPLPTTPIGLIPDSCSQFEDMDSINAKILPNVKQLIQTLYFKYWKVNLWRECQFWKDGMFCTNQNCAVNAAEEDEIPEDYKTSKLSTVDMTGASKDFSAVFGSCDYTNKDFCVLDNEASSDAVYVNLLTNPERFTGYSGEPANRVWRAIYEENCFNTWQGEEPRPMDLGKPEEAMCTERRVFYRLISGLHSGISIGICNDWLNRTSGEWQPNLDCYIWKVGNFPDRIQNVYFNYAVIMRAISKISPWLKKYKYCTTDPEADAQVQSLMKKILAEVKSCSTNFFDEKQLFADKESKKFANEFKASFRNISRIMDCVSCDKCKMWGKLQVTGLGTALKILFALDNNPSNYRLTRTELVALFNSFARYSVAIQAIQNFKVMAEERNKLVEEMAKVKEETLPPLGILPLTEAQLNPRKMIVTALVGTLIASFIGWLIFTQCGPSQQVPTARIVTDHKPKRVRKTE